MNTRSWFHVGLSLMGIHLLFKFFIAVPSSLHVLSLGLNGMTTSAAATVFFKLLAGLLLLIKAPRWAGSLADRLD